MFVFFDYAMTSGPDEVITRRSRIECWYLWCLLRPEIGCYLCGTVERVAECETAEIANIHAVFMFPDEKMAG
jgi:hypothetical protein